MLKFLSECLLNLKPVAGLFVRSVGVYVSGLLWRKDIARGLGQDRRRGRRDFKAFSEGRGDFKDFSEARGGFQGFQP